MKNQINDSYSLTIPFSASESYGLGMELTETCSSIFSTLLDSVKNKESVEKSHMSVVSAEPQTAQNGLKNYIAPRVRLEDPDASVADDMPIKPQRLMRELSLKLPETARVFVDAGNSWAWATHYLHLKKKGMYRIGIGFGSMTWAIGACIGSAVATKDGPTVCITGDGSYMMSGQELSVAVAEKLPVIFIILNDNALGMVKHGQRLGGAEQIAFELPPVDFSRQAKSLGASALTIRTIDELDALDFETIGKRQGPTLIEVQIDPEAVPPMGSRMKALGRD